MGRGRALLVLVCLAAGIAHATPPTRWPLDLPPVLTSSFGEFRANHLHAGIDLGTGGRIGAPCRAVGDGSIVRMRMSPYGYGKALYLALDSGPLVVYGHLSRFAAPMAERARAEQLRRRRYTFDIDLPAGEMRITRGQVIAWSGQTGVGFPHLHFEMRDGDVAFNPQTAGFAVRDTIPPVVDELFAMPMDAGSHVAGELETRRVPMGPPSHAGRASEPEPLPGSRAVQDAVPVGTTAALPLVVGGRIGFAMRAWDHTSSREHRQGPYRYELRVDGKTLFRLVNERFDYADNGLVVLEYDQERLVENGEKVQLLYLRPGDRLPGREAPQPAGGVLVTSSDDPNTPAPFGPGEHTVEVEVADAAGNLTIRSGRVYASMPPSIWIEGKRESGRCRWTSEAEDPDLPSGREQLDARFECSRDGGARWTPLAVTTRAPGSSERRWSWSGEVEWDGASPILLRARVHDFAGLEDVATWAGPARTDTSGVAPPAVRLVWRPRWLEVEVETPPRPSGPEPVLRCPGLQGGSDHHVRNVGPGRYRAALGFGDCATRLESGFPVGPERRELAGRVEIPFQFRLVGAGQAARVEDLEPGLVIDIPAGALLEDVALRAEKVRPASLRLGAELAAAGPCLALLPRSAALGRAVRVSLGPADSARVGLFGIDRSGDLSFLGAERGAGGAIVAETRFLSTVALLRDTTPPRIGSARVVPRGKRPQQLRFTVRDDGAGIGDGGVETEVDGAFAIPEWDPETGEVIVEPQAKLGPGVHRLRIEATDQLGNRAERTVRLQVP